MELVAAVTVLLLIQYLVFLMQVGNARVKTGVQAPAVSGDPVFERYFRVQQNTLEQLILVIPGLWIFSYHMHQEIGAGLGLAFFIGRILYSRGYVNDPANRGIGFMIGGLATLALLLGAAAGIVMKLI
jgi:glutathione S-transferase